MTSSARQALHSPVTLEISKRKNLSLLSSTAGDGIQKPVWLLNTNRDTRKQQFFSDDESSGFHEPDTPWRGRNFHLGLHERLQEGNRSSGYIGISETDTETETDYFAEDDKLKHNIRAAINNFNVDSAAAERLKSQNVSYSQPNLGDSEASGSFTQNLPAVDNHHHQNENDDEKNAKNAKNKNENTKGHREVPAASPAASISGTPPASIKKIGTSPSAEENKDKAKNENKDENKKENTMLLDEFNQKELPMTPDMTTHSESRAELSETNANGAGAIEGGVPVSSNATSAKKLNFAPEAQTTQTSPGSAKTGPVLKPVRPLAALVTDSLKQPSSAPAPTPSTLATVASPPSRVNTNTSVNSNSTSSTVMITSPTATTSKSAYTDEFPDERTNSSTSKISSFKKFMRNTSGPKSKHGVTMVTNGNTGSSIKSSSPKTGNGNFQANSSSQSVFNEPLEPTSTSRGASFRAFSKGLVPRKVSSSDKTTKSRNADNSGMWATTSAIPAATKTVTPPDAVSSLNQNQSSRSSRPHIAPLSIPKSSVTPLSKLDLEFSDLEKSFSPGSSITPGSQTSTFNDILDTYLKEQDELGNGTSIASNALPTPPISRVDYVPDYTSQPHTNSTTNSTTDSTTDSTTSSTTAPAAQKSHLRADSLIVPKVRSNTLPSNRTRNHSIKMRTSSAPTAEDLKLQAKLDRLNKEIQECDRGISDCKNVIAGLRPNMVPEQFYKFSKQERDQMKQQMEERQLELSGLEKKKYETGILYSKALAHRRESGGNSDFWVRSH